MLLKRLTLSFLFLIPFPALGVPNTVVLEVFAGEHGRAGKTPVFFKLPAALAAHDHFALMPTDGNAIPVQRTGGKKNPQIAWLLEQPLAPAERRRYLLEPRDAPQAGFEAATCVDDGRHLLLKVGDRTVLQYNHAAVEAPDGIDPVYRRSGHIHPLFSPSGKVITGDFAADHPHQHGVFFPWRKAIFQERPVDFWNEAAATGKIEHKEIRRADNGPVFAEFVVALRHDDLTAPGGPVTVLEETWTVRVYNRSDAFLVDFESRQRCATDAPLTVEEYHYGGMAIRGNAQWLADAETTGRIKELTRKGAAPAPGELAALAVPRDYLTSEGKTWVDGNATRARWVDMHGMIDGEPSGVTIFCHPKNFRAPQPVRLHPSKPYFCFAPMALGEFAIEPGKPFVSRYRFCVHDGPADAEASERLWRDYASPPTVDVVPQ